MCIIYTFINCTQLVANVNQSGLKNNSSMFIGNLEKFSFLFSCM